MPWHESIIESELAKTKVLINATSIGLTDDVTPIPGEILPPDLLVLDLIYKPDAAAARRRGGRRTVADGEMMLLHQGAAAFTLWTGQPAPLEVMQRKLAEARAGGLRSAEGEPAGDEPARRRRATARRADVDASGHGPRRRAAEAATRRRPAPVGRLRFLTAGESHGQTLGVTLEGVPAGLAAVRGRPRASTSRDASAATAAARARRSSTTGPRSSPASATAGRSARRSCCMVANRDWENWTRVMQVEALSDDEAADARGARRGRQQAGDAGHPRPARPRRPRGRAQVRPQRRAQRAGAGVRARDGGAGRRRRRRPRVPRASSASRSGRSRPRSAASRSIRRDATPLARGGRRVAAALPGPRRGGGDDRPDRRGAVERRHGRRRVRGRRPRRADRARARTSTGTAGSTRRWPPRS